MPADQHALQAKLEEAVGELRVRNRELETLTGNIPGGVHQCRNDQELSLISISKSFSASLGFTREEIRKLFQDRFIEMIYPWDRSAVLRQLSDQLSCGDLVELEFRVQTKSGDLVWFLDKGRLVTEPNGSKSLYFTMLDITDRKKAQEELRLSLERYRVIMNQTTDIIFEWDLQSDTLFFSTNWRKKYGYDPLEGHFSALAPRSRNIHAEDMDIFMRLIKDTANGIPYSEAEFRIRDVTGIYSWCRVRSTTQFNQDGRPIKAIGVIVDIDAEKKQKQKLMEQAQKDSLTGLLNKAATGAQVNDSLRLFAGRTHTMMIIDLDNFKTVNDQCGHLCGDAVLLDMSQALKKLFRVSDVVGRIGGDEFLVFLPNVSGRGLVMEKAEMILRELGEIGKREKLGFELSCSIGAAFYPDDAKDYFGLYRRADQALYHVKNTGKHDVAFYEPEQGDRGSAAAVSHTAVNETIDSDLMDFDQMLSQYAFRMLYDAPDASAAILKILEIVGRAYGISRVYIFENIGDGQACRNTFEWCNDGIQPQMRKMQALPYPEGAECFLLNFDEDGVFYCRDTEELSPAALLYRQGILSLLQCAIMDHGEFRGFIGFDDSLLCRCWTKSQVKSLLMICRILSTFLLKLRLQEKLAQSGGQAADCAGT